MFPHEKSFWFSLNNEADMKRTIQGILTQTWICLQRPTLPLLFFSPFFSPPGFASSPSFHNHSVSLHRNQGDRFESAQWSGRLCCGCCSSIIFLRQTQVTLWRYFLNSGHGLMTKWELLCCHFLPPRQILLEINTKPWHRFKTCFLFSLLLAPWFDLVVWPSSWVCDFPAKERQ